MIISRSYELRAVAPDTTVHKFELGLKIERTYDLEEMSLSLRYLEGSLVGLISKDVIEWKGLYQAADAAGKNGYVDIGGGDRYMPKELQGAGIGSLLTNILIAWAHSLPPVQVWPIILTNDDAPSEEAMKRRNGFWEKFGFSFQYVDGGKAGESLVMTSDKLIGGGFTTYEKNGWVVQIDPSLHEDLS